MLVLTVLCQNDWHGKQYNACFCWLQTSQSLTCTSPLMLWKCSMLSGKTWLQVSSGNVLGRRMWPLVTYFSISFWDGNSVVIHLVSRSSLWFTCAWMSVSYCFSFLFSVSAPSSKSCAWLSRSTAPCLGMRIPTVSSFSDAIGDFSDFIFFFFLKPHLVQIERAFVDLFFSISSRSFFSFLGSWFVRIHFEEMIYNL